MAEQPEKVHVKDLKKKKKKWLTILASHEFRGQEIGETYIEEPEHALGRHLKVNLMTLTKDPKRQNYNVYFKITEVKNNQALTELVAYKMQLAQIKKITKKARNKIEDSEVFETKDKKKMVIKPAFVTKSMTYKTSLSSVRLEARKFLAAYAKQTEASLILQDIIMNNLQRELKNAVKKIVPVTTCNIKAAYVEE
ncbi:MAG TPA: hypothetical protein VJI68_00410 [Candidatus Nanoarchaeia archaeon]|nr:hypothetical protein [Candidatus Nanoarchaeia archaeon]